MSNRLTVGSTYRFRVTVQKDSATWDLSAATVQLKMRKPAGTILTFSASLVSGGTGGIAQYESDTVDLDTAGVWRRSWWITDGDVVARSIPVSFAVISTP